VAPVASFHNFFIHPPRLQVESVFSTTPGLLASMYSLRRLPSIGARLGGPFSPNWFCSTPVGKMVFTLLGAELERSLTVERVRAGCGMHARRGRRWVGRALTWVARRLRRFAPSNAASGFRSGAWR
jgi:hypothetical protein